MTGRDSRIHAASANRLIEKPWLAYLGNSRNIAQFDLLGRFCFDVSYAAEM